MPYARPTVLVVDDEEVIRGTFVDLLSEGYEVRPATNLDEARRTLASERVDLIVLDWLYDDASTAEPLIRELASRDESPAIVLVSVSRLAIDAGARYHIPVLCKPFDLDVLLTTVTEALTHMSRPSMPQVS